MNLHEKKYQGVVCMEENNKITERNELDYIYDLYHGLEKPDFGKYIEDWEI